MNLNGEEFREVMEFQYLRLSRSVSGEMEVNVNHRLNEVTSMKEDLAAC